MIFDRIKQEAMKAAMSPATMKLLSDPRIQKVMMRAIQLPSEVRDALEKNGQSIAKTFSLVTKDDLRAMKRTIRDLSAQLEKLNYELEAERQKNEQLNRLKESKTDKPSPAAKKATKTKATGKKKITIKRKTKAVDTKAASPKPPAKKKIKVKRKVKVTAKKK